ncbi:SRPBCC family protein [Cryobacterium frigoriphilum]|uniref:SRPBCC family protein n=1 Tax=Cryobacterium frigoriphilum TaxID=1259150 RepID=UPI001F542FF8|nr:SRPBCC family protein [Cryobacterium frigoriphilum]
MQLDSTFTVVAPVDTVWATLMDFERVAGCVPGAQILNRLSDDAYQVGMKVKLGPVTMAYRGQMNVLERDAAAHRAVFDGKAQETRGQGTASATVTLVLVETDGTTQGTVSADLALSGKAAAMGKGVIGSVTDQMMALFASNLQQLIEQPATDAAGTDTGETPVGAHLQEPTEHTQESDRAVAEMADIPPGEAYAADRLTAVTPGPGEPRLDPRRNAPGGVSAAGAAGAAGAHRPLPHHSPPVPPETSLNAMDLVKGVVADQLSNPAKLLGVIVGVAFVAYRIGRRRSGR